MYKRFEELCKEKNVTPYKVAKDTGITTATLSNWKAGRYTPKIDKMARLAKYFNVSYSYLAGRSDERVQKVTHIDLTPTIDLIEENAVKDYLLDGNILIETEEASQDIKDALDLYKAYKNAPAHVQAAIETLLKSEKQES